MSVDYTASWTQICNRALGRLGNDTITDLEDGTRTAGYCKRLLPEAIESVLGQWNFKFAKRRITLSPNEDKPLFGWKYQFNLPIDLLRLVEVYMGHNDRPEDCVITPYQVENGKLLADEELIQILYIIKPDDPNSMPQAVRKAISTTLAYLLSTPLTANEQLIALLAGESTAAIEDAKKRDAEMNYDPYANGQEFHVEKRR